MAVYTDSDMINLSSSSSGKAPVLAEASSSGSSPFTHATEDVSKPKLFVASPCYSGDIAQEAEAWMAKRS